MITARRMMRMTGTHWAPIAGPVILLVRRRTRQLFIRLPNLSVGIPEIGARSVPWLYTTD